MRDAELPRYLKKVRKLIAKHGHAVQQVDQGDEGPGWSYTIGLHASGFPELIMIGGVSLDGQVEILNRLAGRMCDGEVLRPGDRDPTLLKGVDVMFLEVVDTTTEDFAVAHPLQSDFRALQVVWPDRENRFPWEPDCSLPADVQRLLGVPDLAE